MRNNKHSNINLEQYLVSDKELQYLEDLRDIENYICSINSICKRLGFIYSRNFELMLHSLLHYYFIPSMIEYYDTDMLERFLKYGYALLTAKIINHLGIFYDLNKESDLNKISEWITEVQNEKYKKIPNAGCRATDKISILATNLLYVTWYTDYLSIIFRLLLNDIAWKAEDRKIYEKIVFIDDLECFKSINDYVNSLNKIENSVSSKYSIFHFCLNAWKDKLTFDEIMWIFLKLKDETIDLIMKNISESADAKLPFEFNSETISCSKLRSTLHCVKEIRNFSCHSSTFKKINSSKNGFFGNLYNSLLYFPYKTKYIDQELMTSEFIYQLTNIKMIFQKITSIIQSLNLEQKDKMIKEIRKYLDYDNFEKVIGFIKQKSNYKAIFQKIEDKLNIKTGANITNNEITKEGE